ncbi:MAG: tRNA pseudouridine(55) synthase TruB [bacterium]|nr:tRNA pseudouridine(55) synthase TruB [bacterium]
MDNKQDIINLNKPAGPTSHDMVDLVRKVRGERTVGHAGTLDPFAEGVLLILVGREATRRQKEFMSMPKTYVATLCLGATSDTDDLTGKITDVIPAEVGIHDLEVETAHGSRIKSGMTKEHIEKVLKSFIGDIEQVPPAYSAIKLKGKKAYELARKGITPELKSRIVHIEDIKLLRYTWPKLEIEVDCGSGTYIRSLARDIGKKIGCGAYVEKLVRTRIGPYLIEEAVFPDHLKTSSLQT